MTESAPTLHVVLFDLDDTLYSTTEFAHQARRNAVKQMIAQGLRISEDEAFAELSEVVAEFSSNYDQHFGRLLDRLGPETYEGRNPAVIMAAGVVGYHRTKAGGLRMLPDVRETLEALREAGVRAGVLSAGLHVKQAEKLIRLDALRYFDDAAIFFSDQMGVSKPNPKIYAKACAALAVDPASAMYVGDRPTHDIEPAAGIGMKTVHYTGASGAHCQATDGIRPDHMIDDMRELLTILRDEYGVVV